MKTITIFCILVIVTGAQQTLAQRRQMERFVRQTGRFGVSNYRPVLPGLPAVRGNAVANNIPKQGPATRPLQGVGAYSFGGAAGGRPAFGPNYPFNAVVGGGGGVGSVGSSGGGGGVGVLRAQATLNNAQVSRPQQNQIYRGAGVAGRPHNAYSYN